MPAYRFDDREGRRLFLYAAQKELEVFRGAFYLDMNAAGVVVYQARQTVPLRQGEDEGAEPNSLHDSPYGYLPALG